MRIRSGSSFSSLDRATGCQKRRKYRAWKLGHEVRNGVLKLVHVVYEPVLERAARVDGLPGGAVRRTDGRGKPTRQAVKKSLRFAGLWMLRPPGFQGCKE